MWRYRAAVLYRKPRGRVKAPRWQVKQGAWPFKLGHGEIARGSRKHLRCQGHARGHFDRCAGHLTIALSEVHIADSKPASIDLAG